MGGNLHYKADVLNYESQLNKTLSPTEIWSKISPFSYISKHFPKKKKKPENKNTALIPWLRMSPTLTEDLASYLNKQS